MLRGAKTPSSVDGVRSKTGADSTVNHHFSTLCRHTFPLQLSRQLFRKLGTGEIIEVLPLGLAKPLEQEENEDVGVLGGFTEVVFAVFRSNWILSSLICFVEL